MRVLIILTCLIFGCQASSPNVTFLPSSSDRSVLSESPDPIKCDEEDSFEMPVVEHENLPEGILLDECTYRKITANEARLNTLEREAYLLQDIRKAEIEAVRKAESRTSEQISALQPSFFDQIKFETGVVVGSLVTIAIVYATGKVQQ